jgi:hypothetical protein
MNAITLTDALGDKFVQIAIQVAIHPTDRALRPVVVSVGIEGMPPQILTGTFEQIATLIDHAWRTFPTTITTTPATTVSATSVVAHATTPAVVPSARPPVTPNPVAPASTTQGILDLF